MSKQNIIKNAVKFGKKLVKNMDMAGAVITCKIGIKCNLFLFHYCQVITYLN